jgi:hypothetical protein
VVVIIAAVLLVLFIEHSPRGEQLVVESTNPG